MLEITDQKFFCEIIADSIAQTHLNFSDPDLRNRWINAFAKAASVILEGDLTFLHWNPFEEILYFWSADSNEIYEIGESSSCDCPAFRRRKPMPCYHRAMQRLVKNYFDFLQKPGSQIQKIDFADAVFFDLELSVREKVRLLNGSILEGRVELKPRVAALERFASP